MLQWKPRALTVLAVIALVAAALVGNFELFGWWW